MVAADGSRAWPQSLQRYTTIYSKHVSQDICGDRASVSVIYTQTAGLDPPLLQSSQGWNLGVGKKYHWFAFTACTLSMNSSLAFDVRSQCPLTASIKRRQNVFTAASPGRREKAASPTPLVQLPAQVPPSPRVFPCPGTLVLLVGSPPRAGRDHS